MEASFRKTSNSTNKFRRFGEEVLPPIRSERHTKMNVQRREKLGATLTEKLITKFGAQKNRGLVQKEVNQFLNQIETKNDKIFMKTFQQKKISIFKT